MKTKHQLYNASAEEIREQIKKLAQSYTPEWLFDTKNPDAGSVIALLFAEQLEETAGQYNLFPERFHDTLTRLLPVSPLPARPARGTVIIGLMRGAPEGTFLPAGTRLNGMKAGGEERITGYETVHDLYAAAARLTDITAISGPGGCILPVYEGDGEPPAFPIFQFLQPGIAKNELFLLHRNFISGSGDTLLLRAEGRLPRRTLILHYTDRGLVPLTPGIREEEEGIYELYAEEADKKTEYRGKEYGVLCLSAEGPVREEYCLSKLALCVKGTPAAADYVLCAGEEGEPGDFLPFGREIGLYRECYIGCGRIFQREGALITLTFELSFEKNRMGRDPAEEPFEPRLIRRRRPAPLKLPLYQTSAQETVLEYFNGKGWKRIRTEQETTGIFQGNKEGKQSISFMCPDGWQAAEEGGFSGLSLRFRILRADNCYQQPCDHIYPRIRELTLSYSFQEKWEPPACIKRICGTRVTDYSRLNQDGRRIPAFSPLPYDGNACYLGFQKEFGGGPVGIYFDLEAVPSLEERTLNWEYSASGGFRPLRVRDHTGGLTHPGIVIFSPPTDFRQRELEGKTRFWLKVNAPEHGEGPVIKEIRMNAVGVANIETKPPEEFFIEHAEANMEFTIHAEGILRTEVWVNEREGLSVQWEEVEDFSGSSPGDRHYCLDRRNSRIRFGDGLHVRIPGPCSGPAFTVKAVCCSGRDGNLEPGGIKEAFSHLMFVEQIDNPGGALGGSDMESPEGTRKRGARLLGSGRRILTLRDFEQEGEAFSDVIDKAACEVRGGTVVMALLLKNDHDDGGQTFRELSRQLKNHLLSRCECTIRPEDLLITEPFFVDISVEVRAAPAKGESPRQARLDLLQGIREYLEPVSRPGSMGWRIGSLPSQGQLRLALSTAFHGFIRELSVTVSYLDEKGRHETSLEDMPPHPFCIGRNGRHRIIMTGMEKDKRKGGGSA